MRWRTRCGSGISFQGQKMCTKRENNELQNTSTHKQDHKQNRTRSRTSLYHATSLLNARKKKNYESLHEVFLRSRHSAPTLTSQRGALNSFYSLVSGAGVPPLFPPLPPHGDYPDFTAQNTSRSRSVSNPHLRHTQNSGTPRGSGISVPDQQHTGCEAPTRICNTCYIIWC